MNIPTGAQYALNALLFLAYWFVAACFVQFMVGFAEGIAGNDMTTSVREFLHILAFLGVLISTLIMREFFYLKK